MVEVLQNLANLLHSTVQTVALRGSPELAVGLRDWIAEVDCLMTSLFGFKTSHLSEHGLRAVNSIRVSWHFVLTGVQTFNEARGVFFTADRAALCAKLSKESRIIARQLYILAIEAAAEGPLYIHLVRQLRGKFDDFACTLH